MDKRDLGTLGRTTSGSESGSPGRGRVMKISAGGRGPRTRKGNWRRVWSEAGGSEWGGAKRGEGALGERRGPQKWTELE